MSGRRGLAALGCLGLVGILGAPIILVLLVAGAAVALLPGVSAASASLGEEVPEPYRAVILAAAQACPGLPAGILAGQLAAESDWNPNAVSPVGAQGIAQFMPGTWANWGRDANGDGTADPFDPADAIDAQGRFMCHLLQAARSSGFEADPIDLALAGYNAGWGAVKAHRGVPPYPQTTGYVERIRAAEARYTAPAAPPVPVGPGGAVWPVDDPNPIRNPFRNVIPGAGYDCGWHTGVDFTSGSGSSMGRPVRAARAGIVESTANSGDLGRHIVIGHGDGLYTAYGHLASIDPAVTPRAAVRAGQQIGTIGCSGMSRCGPHLHFEVRRGPTWQCDTFLDPMPWLGLGHL